MYKELFNDVHISRVRGVQFSVMSPDTIQARSVMEVTVPYTYSGNEPVPNGLFDPRMGVVDHNRECKTCGQRNTFCPGHFGHVILSKPVFYVQFFETVRKLLKCVCYRCSRILTDTQSPEVKALLARKGSRHARWEAMSALCSKAKRCGGGIRPESCGCGARQPDRISKTSDQMKLKMEWKRTAVGASSSASISRPSNIRSASVDDGDAIASLVADTSEVDPEEESVVEGGAPEESGSSSLAPEEIILSAEEALRILRRISDADILALGFSPALNKPEWMICTVLHVPPPSVRPSMRSDVGQRSEDDLTHILSDVIKVNNSIRQKIEKGATWETVDMLTNVLQYHVATLVDNSVPTMNAMSKDRGGRTMRTLKVRLKGKDGRIRGNLMGKRVDFSARTVITPDPNISIDELGVPLRIAMNMTIPQIVTDHNLVSLSQLLANGPNKYPGAKHVRKLSEETPRTVRIRAGNEGALQLQIGDVVERHLQDGDYVLFNRQPSLHKMSMMAHRIRVMPYNTFRLNVCVCASYNADFDGDEMNMHVPQSLQTLQELVALAAVPLHIISPRHSKPIITVVQDVALGAFRMTRGAAKLSPKQFMNIASSTPHYSCRLPQTGPHGMLTGRQLMSTVIPAGITVDIIGKIGKDDANYSEDEHHVVIRDGHVLSGALDVDVFKRPSRGLVHSIFNDLGPGPLMSFLNATQKIVCDWLMLDGFSVGISDLVVSTDVKSRFRERLQVLSRDVSNAMLDSMMGRLENKSTRSNHDNFEVTVNDLLSATTNEMHSKAAAAFKSLDSNRMLNMITCGSKGDHLRLSQMVTCVGQQYVDSMRIGDGFEHRTLPHFTRFDDGVAARGFVANSFIGGLTPQEFFFHSMGGRIGLIDTAVRTSETGYIQRKLVKSMEDCRVRFDLSVRNSAGNIVQFFYGEDGIDAAKLEYQVVLHTEMSLASMRDAYQISHPKQLEPYLDPDTYRRVASTFPEWQPDAARHFGELLDDRAFIVEKVFGAIPSSKTVLAPVNVRRILETWVNTAVAALAASGGGAVDRLPPSDLDPAYVFRCLGELEADLTDMVPRFWTDDENGRDKHRAAPLIIRICRSYLSPKPLLTKYGLSRVGFDDILVKIRLTFLTSLAQPGEMVGIIAAQSIGEPTTQMTLNTFHLSGISSASGAVTQAVPRLRELFHATRAIKTPSMKIFLPQEFSTSQEKASKVLIKIQTTRLRDVVRISRVYYDPPPPRGDKPRPPEPDGDVRCESPQLPTSIQEDVEMLRLYDEYVTYICGGVDDSGLAPSSPWLLRLELDRNQLLTRMVTMSDVHFAILDFVDKSPLQLQLSCVLSDDNSEGLVVRIRYTPPSGTERDDVLTEVMALEQTIMEKVVIKGVPGIEKAQLQKPEVGMSRTWDPRVQEFVDSPEWTIVTSGSALMDVLCHPNVDFRRTRTNNVHEVLRVLGIEAARQVLYDELQNVMWMGGNQHDVNYRHMALLVDTMTTRGTLVSINRHGISKGDIGPLAKCSFETTDDMLIQAGIFGELDTMNGVSACVMLGQVPPCGTGTGEILMDPDALPVPSEEALSTMFRGLDRGRKHDEEEAYLYAPRDMAVPLKQTDAATQNFGIEEIIIV